MEIINPNMMAENASSQHCIVVLSPCNPVFCACFGPFSEHVDCKR